MQNIKWLGLFFIGMAIMSMLGCEAPTATNQSGRTSPSTNRLEIVDGPLVIGHNYIYVIRDKETETEYIFCDEATSLTPIHRVPSSVPLKE